MFGIKESRVNGFIVTAAEIKGFEIQLTLEMSGVSVLLSSSPQVGENRRLLIHSLWTQSFRNTQT